MFLITAYITESPKDYLGRKCKGQCWPGFFKTSSCLKQGSKDSTQLFLGVILLPSECAIFCLLPTLHLKYPARYVTTPFR